jgi:hypothetical protein
LARTILLIEDDEFDRTTLTRLLEDSGYGVMATHKGKPAVDTFAIYHRSVSLVLASAGLTDVERIRLSEALYRIAPRVPVVMAGRRASHRPNSGEDSGRSALFAALIAEVHRRLGEVSARAAAQVRSFARVQPPAPMEIERPDRPVRSHQSSRLDEQATFFSEDAPYAWTGSARLTSVANVDPRNYLRRLDNARRSRRRRLRRIGLAIAVGCCAPLVVTPLLQMRTTTARASAEDEALLALPPLASASISARMGIVPLVSSPHINPSYVDVDVEKAKVQPRRGHKPTPDRRK